MSEDRKNILGTILMALLSVFIQNWDKLVAKLRSKIPENLDAKISWIIQIVEDIKNYVPVSGGDLVEAVIPGDGPLSVLARKILADILAEYNLFDIAPADLKRGHLKLISDELTARLTGTSYGQASLTNQVVYTSTYEGKQEQTANA